MEIIALILAVTSLILHFVAPRTKTTADDTALEYVDKAKDLVGGLKK